MSTTSRRAFIGGTLAALGAALLPESSRPLKPDLQMAELDAMQKAATQSVIYKSTYSGPREDICEALFREDVYDAEKGHVVGYVEYRLPK